MFQDQAVPHDTSIIGYELAQPNCMFQDQAIPHKTTITGYEIAQPNRIKPHPMKPVSWGMN